jgi:hypothetical protein
MGAESLAEGVLVQDILDQCLKTRRTGGGDSDLRAARPNDGRDNGSPLLPVRGSEPLAKAVGLKNGVHPADVRLRVRWTVRRPVTMPA